MNKPSGSTIKQTFTLFPNGTLIVSDSSGNTFGIIGLSGLPDGLRSSVLVANSTQASENYIVTSGQAATLANVTISFSIKKQFCQPSGLDISLNGNVDWSTSNTGIIGLTFNKERIVNSAESILLLRWSWQRTLC